VTYDQNNVTGHFANLGGVQNFDGPINIGASAPAPAPAPGRTMTAEVGVLTVINPEIQAVVAALRQMYDYRERRLPDGPLAYEAWLPGRHGRQVRVAAVQTLEQGNEQAALAYRRLVEQYNPAIVLLVGVAGGVAERVRIGDVVLGDQVISYDHRRETAEGTLRRGRAQAVSAELGHRLNEFFTAVPSEQLRPGNGTFALHRGPVGSGNAVVTDAGSEIRRWLYEFHEKVLAVETESAGVAQSFHESVRQDGVRGWLTIRGISDTADKAKDDSYQTLAAGHAAEVMAMLLPFLYFTAS
jgi:adenosylhomocysteine nucleosidase